MSCKIEEYVKKYIHLAELTDVHSMKLLYLSELMREIFDVQIEDLAPGIEKKLGSSIIGFRGKADLVFSEVVLEIKTHFEREIDDAKAQLLKYLEALHEVRPTKKQIGIATDGIKFIAFMPLFENEKVVDLQEISSLDMRNYSTIETIAWLDSFIFSKHKVEPTATDLNIKFGLGSPLHLIMIDSFEKMWKEVENDPNVKLKLDLWTKNMEIVYGVSPDIDTFFRHTYLVTLIKLAIYLRLAGKELPNEEQILKTLSGEYFESYGISNLIEEDFFSWILHQKIVDNALKASKEFAKALQQYDLSRAEEDLFKEIYEAMVELKERHRLGEYYTPEWLSKKTVLLALQHWEVANNKTPRILDPACGSGTFLTNVIHLMKKECRPENISEVELLELIVNNVVGVDINPLAVMIARANYIIALGELLKLGKPVTIPVYISDSIKLPEALFTVIEGVEVYDIEAGEYHLQIPKDVSLNAEKRARVLNGLREAIKEYKLRHDADQALQVLHRHTSEIANKAEVSVLDQTYKTLVRLVDKGMDSIWIFMLNNIYATLSLKMRKFDMLISNPPWIVMRSIENRRYQDFLKEQVFNYRLLDRHQINLYTHMEMATLFFCKTTDLYLENGGITAFLMPISVLTGAYHHSNFQRFKKPKMKLLSIHNFGGVKLIFSLPLYVLIAKKGEETKFPVPAFDYVGKLNSSQKNARLENVKDQINSTEYLYRPPIIPKKLSLYYKEFKEGATIVPHNLWFVSFDPMPSLGAFNSSVPSVKTAGEAIRLAKKRWKDIIFEGTVEAEYVCATILGKDLFPFGYGRMIPVVLPIEQSSNGKGYRILDVQDLRLRGASKMAEWLEKAQKIWEERRTQKSIANYPRIVNRLDHHGLLRNQNQRRYLVMYNARGADSFAYVLDRTILPEWVIQNSAIRPQNFVIDSTIFYFETDNLEEGHYVCSLLNSSIIHEAVKGFQPSGLYGKRDIGRRPLRLAIPKFKKTSRDHLDLVRLSKECHETVNSLCNSSIGFRKLRKKAMTELKDKIKQIDEITDGIMK